MAAVVVAGIHSASHLLEIAAEQLRPGDGPGRWMAEYLTHEVAENLLPIHRRLAPGRWDAADSEVELKSR